MQHVLPDKPSAPLARAAARLALLAACALALGCASAPWRGFPERGPEGLVWPAPPEPPRVAFVLAFDRHQQLFAEAGAWRRVQRMLLGEVDSQLQRPHAVALRPGGGLLVADPGAACVHVFDWTRRRYQRLTGEGALALRSPVGVAALPDGRVVVSDSALQRLLVFAPEGTPQGMFAPGVAWQRPAGLAFGAARGELYAADVLAHQIVVLDATGRELRRLGTHGGAPGQFNYPTHVAVTPAGELAVSDAMNFRVQVLTPEGQPVRSVGALGDRPGTFSKLKGVACDGAGNLFAVEGLYGALQCFSPTGALLLSLGGAGHGPGQFWLPAGVCCDPAAGLLFVADSYNRRIQVFRLLGPGGAP